MHLIKLSPHLCTNINIIVKGRLHAKLIILYGVVGDLSEDIATISFQISISKVHSVLNE